jgi:hypothetical protein
MKLAFAQTLPREADFREEDFPPLLEGLREAQRELAAQPLENILELLDLFSRKLLERDNPLHEKFPGSGLPYIASWCRREHLENMLEASLGRSAFLDRFLPFGPEGKSLRAFPRGLVLHWMAGNVPTLSFLSLLCGLLSKNANLVKLPSSAPRLLPALLRELAVLESPRFSGRELCRNVAVLQFPGDDAAWAARLSREADARVIWGADASVAALKKQDSRADVVDVAFPQRSSCMLISARALAGEDWERLARKIAVDISVFEQKACASPHTLFLEAPRQDIRRFAEILFKALEKTLNTLPKTAPEPAELNALLQLRALYDMHEEALYPAGSAFTLLLDNKAQLGPAIGGRCLYLRPLPALERFPDILPRNIQSLGLCVADEELDSFTEALGQCGVLRFPAIGSMTLFEMPWDGAFLPERLVRWVSRAQKQNTGHGGDLHV